VARILRAIKKKKKKKICLAHKVVDLLFLPSMANFVTKAWICFPL
jgi:hypothetical protein